MVGLYAVLVGAVAMERLYELRLSRRNTAQALARGAVEAGQAHYRFMTLFHAVFLPACVLEVWLLERPLFPALAAPCLALLVSSMGLRYWAIATLGSRWNTRVICEPGRPAVCSGPYRWVRHPNYVAVAVELFALPLLHGAWMTAAFFGTTNLVLLRVRIGVEERALRRHCRYDEFLGGKPRFLPYRSS